MSKTQRSLRWHRRRAYEQMSFAHADQSLKYSKDSNNEFVTAMHEANREAAHREAMLLLFRGTREEQLAALREQRKNEKNT